MMCNSDGLARCEMLLLVQWWIDIVESDYNIDGEFLFEGARVLVIADTDSLANNRIYERTLFMCCLKSTKFQLRSQFNYLHVYFSI